MGKLEKEIQKEIIDYLRSEDFFVYKNTSQGQRIQGKGRVKSTTKGIPDLTVLKDGKMFYIEVKTLEGVVSKDQIEWMKNAKKYGARILVADCVEDVRYFIKDF